MIKKKSIIIFSVGFLMGVTTSQYAKRIIPAIKGVIDKKPIEEVANEIKETIKKYENSGYIKVNIK